MNNQDHKKRIFTSLVLFLMIILIIKYIFFLILMLLIFGVFSLIEFFTLIKKIFKNTILKIIYNSLFTFYISCFCLTFFYFSNILSLKILLYTLLFGCIASDLGGYIIGKTFKGAKLTKISPKKTISGALGSFAFTIILIVTIIFLFYEIINYKILMVAFITSLFCQMGDIFFSFLKRKAKVKDTGNIFPGHGGVLDRIDGILLGVPFGFISINYFY